MLRTLTEMPLRDVPDRLDVLALVVDELNTRLAHVCGMFMGAGWIQADSELSKIGEGYVAVEQVLAEWRLELKSLSGMDYHREGDGG